MIFCLEIGQHLRSQDYDNRNINKQYHFNGNINGSRVLFKE